GSLSSDHPFVVFSSRRRHTSFSRDWSSDVCSSDLCDFNTYTSEELRGAKRSDYAGQAMQEVALAGQVMRSAGLPNRPVSTVFFRSEERRAGTDSAARSSRVQRTAPAQSGATAHTAP